jgi:hypothetical protein
MPPPRRGQLPAANKTFVDREAPQRIFENAAVAIPIDRSIVLVFYGVGGQGKTALCRELLRKTNAKIDHTHRFLRCAELDLHDRAKEDSDRLLVWIRNGFADAGVAFPCFDLAFAITWEATRGEEPLPKFTRPWLGRATMAGSDHAKELIGDIVGSVIPGTGFILKRIAHWAIDKGKRLYLERTEDALKELYTDGELKKPFELSGLLPWMIAQDLNTHLITHPTDRFFLFVDEYERVFDEGGAGSKWEENPFDSHMRKQSPKQTGCSQYSFRESCYRGPPIRIGGIYCRTHSICSAGLLKKTLTNFFVQSLSRIKPFDERSSLALEKLHCQIALSILLCLIFKLSIGERWWRHQA